MPWKELKSLEKNNFLIEKEIEKKEENIISNYEILLKKLEVKALSLLINQDLKIIKTVFMPGQKKGKKFMVSKNKNEEKEKIQ